MRAGSKYYLENDETAGTWIITRKCNYDCAYCDCGTDENHKTADSATINRTIQFINHAESIRPVNLTISGGEPTIANLEEILPQLELQRRVILYTNLSKSTAYFKALPNIELYTSWHPDYVSIEEFTQKINELSEHMPVRAKFMVKSFADISTVANNIKFLNSSIKIEVFPIHELGKQYNNLITNLNADKDYIIKAKEYTKFEVQSTPELHKFQGWLCNAGKQSFVLNEQGNFYKCKRDYKQDDSSFNVHDDFIPAFKKIQEINNVCKYKKCAFETHIPKEKK